MEDEVQFYMEHSGEMMEKALAHLDESLAHIRAGKASPRILDGVTVDYYGSETPLSQVSNISTPDARTIAIQPWEKTLIGVIEKAILVANIGLTPDNNGEMIRLNIPPLTEERRKDLVKKCKHEGEEAKISIRAARRDANEQFKKLTKDGLSEDLAKDAEAEIQKMTDKHIIVIDDMVTKKEKEILTV